MTHVRVPVIFVCNSADPPSGTEPTDYTVLDYRRSGQTIPNVRIRLPEFVQSIYHLPDRYLDLLEIASYILAADRLTKRGEKAAVEYHSWARSFQFQIRVRDYDFWSDSEVCSLLRDALTFTTGDRDYRFFFQPGHSTPPTGLFDQNGFQVDVDLDPSIVLFSGGLDSLSGTVLKLEQTRDAICLVSHLSQDGTTRTQRALATALKEEYPNRIHHYQFRTSLQGIRSSEESQRTRTFLFGSIAFAIAKAFDSDHFFIYENGVTSLNFSRREDLLNARASRTTHPQTIGRLTRLFSTIRGQEFVIENPFLWKTKTDVIEVLGHTRYARLLSSSVSCSRTFLSLAQATHCGECFQCVDRRIGVYGAELDANDNDGLYATNILRDSISSPDARTTIVDYLRQAAAYANGNRGYFYMQTLDELQQLIGWVPGIEDDVDLVDSVWDLCHRHGLQVRKALRRMRSQNEDIFSPIPEGSLLKVVSDRTFLEEPIERLVKSLWRRIEKAIPTMFQKTQPINERDLNDKVQSLLADWSGELYREHPSIPFAGRTVRPDFSADRAHLLIELKYIRGSTTPSKVGEAMAADLVQYPQEAHVMFVVYDPEGRIVDKERFTYDFEKQGRCSLYIVR